MIHPTLYKRTSAGKIQIWFAETEGDKYRTTSGQQEGKKTTADWTLCEPKNVGRANATTGAEQALIEVEAMYVKQKKRDYRASIDEVDTITRFKPMLAESWAKRKDKVKAQHVYMQPKLDGIRCIANAKGMWTRNGEPHRCAQHIWEALKPHFDADPTLVLDGELYNHEFKDDFNRIQSLVNKKKPTPEDLEESAKYLQYWIYDCPSVKGSFEVRFKALELMYGMSMLEANPNIVLTDTLCVATELVDKHAGEWMDLGYEGAMVRLPGDYENKRSKTLLKWKEFQDREYKIYDIQEGKGNRAGMAARVVLQLTSNNATFSAGIIGNEEYCMSLLAEKDSHIGKMGTVVFQNFTPDGVPRFPKFKAVRLVD